MSSDSADTIFALSSGPPPAGVAIIRVSGPGVRFGLETLIDSVPEPRRATLRSIRTGEGEVLDRGLALFFPAPASFTGEDMAELHLHGGRSVIAGVLSALETLEGFRPAEAGEFTRRAFLNQRLDLTEAEGIADLVRAETEAQRRQALGQAAGGLRQLYEGWRERLVRARALVEAELDFPEEEDIPGSVGDEAWAEVERLEREIAKHLKDGHRGERLREGAEIVLLGPPNSGKSSLINALARREVAIVMAEPGTTRDLLEVRLDLAGYPATVVDTAGLREASGLVEREGIRRAEARAKAADLVLWLNDVTQPPSPAPSFGAVPVITIGTKIDVVDSEEERSQHGQHFELHVSARTSTGMDALLLRLGAFVAAEFAPGESPLITRSRYRSALTTCLAALAAARLGKSGELRAEELRRATDSLGRITGRVDVEDLLDVIFREFCIGK
jgi:tRNA modification GTPase